jgi:hypothetical protein
MGVTTTRASTTIIVEPQYKESDMTQGLMRIYRLGQEYQTRTFRFTVSGYVTEMVIMNRGNFRQLIQRLDV